jgi:peptidoglycan DL-endopeptidase CwlO
VVTVSKRQNIMAAFGIAAVVTAPTAQAVPIVGGQGLTPNARAVVEYVVSTYPGVQSIGGIRACDSVGEHCRGVAVDIMVGGNTALGNQINADLSSQTGRFGISYILWLTAGHGDHLHVSVAG